jgi:photosynthetic reaction center cytochrome c subunit
MNRPVIKTLFAALAVVAGLTLTSAAIAQTPAAPAAEASKTAEQAFKNVLVLKGIPAEQVIPAMQFIANSLGVECEFCHVEHAFEKDDKKSKLTARKMIEMQMAINKANFKGDTEVTCNTCHRGAERPVSVPVIGDQDPKRPETPAAAAAATPGATPTPVPAEPILDKYLQAVGGAEALQKITSRAMKGEISFGERKFPVNVLAKAPNKRISSVHTPNGDNITAFDGQAGWLGNPGGRPPRDMNAQESEAASFDATFYLPTEIKKMFTRFVVRPAPDKIGGREVVQVIGLKEGKPPLRFFFDKESGLLLRTVRYAETPLGRNPTQVDYADYRAEGGIKLPFQWTVARPLGRFTIQISEMQQNVAIEDAKFAKPAAADKK